jgi:hypothetical protein
MISFLIGEVDGFVDVDSQSLPNVQIIEKQRNAY